MVHHDAVSSLAPIAPLAPRDKLNDLQLLRSYEPVVKYTEGELFFPMAVDPYVAAASLWQIDADKQRTQLVPPGALTVEELGRRPEPPSGHTLYLRFQGEPLTPLAYRHWHARPDRPILHAAGRLSRVSIGSRVISSLFNFSLLLRGSVPGGTAAAADIAVRGIRNADERFVYYGRVLRQGGYTILHYVFFFAMNDWRSSFHGINDHEADWEQCFVYLVAGPQGQLEPRWVAFASHDYSGDDLRRRWDDPELTLVDGRHPVIYAGAGSHASYCLRGEYITGVEPKFLRPLRNFAVAVRKLWVEKLAQGNSANVQEEVSSYFRIAFVDYARGDGVAVGPGQSHGWTPTLLDNQPWVENYRGLWGVDTEDPFGGERAPAGPKYNRDGSVRLAWYDPLAWAGLDKVPPPQEAPSVLSAQIQQLEAERSTAEVALDTKRQAVRALELQANALLGNEYWRPIVKGQADALNKAQAELQAHSAHLQTLVESQLACRQLLRRLEQGDWGDPQAHLHHQHRPEAPLPRQSHLLDLWGAVSGALLMLVMLLLLIYTPANWYVWIVVAVLLSLGVESWLRRRLARYLINVTIFLAIVTTVVLLIAFWRFALVLAVIGLAAIMLRDNLRELRRP
jgi:hypothetical protein